MNRKSEGKSLRKSGFPNSSGSISHPAWWCTPITCLLLALAVWIVFGQILRHDFVNVDDDVYVTENNHVAAGLTGNAVRWAFTNLQAGFWHPLTWLSFLMDAQLYGIRASGFHLTNLLIHLASTLLLFAVLRRMTGLHWQSAFVAALFAVHPLHVESVAWISERKGLLSTGFFLLSLWMYARFAQRSEAGNLVSPNRSPASVVQPLRSGNYWLALLFFACGLMSKTMVVTLPVVMLLLDLWPLRRLNRSTVIRLVVEKSPFFALAVAAGWLTIHAEKDIGALAEGGVLPLKWRFANAAISTARYLTQTIWPTDFAVFYPYPNSFPIALVLGSLVLLALISVFAIWQIRQRPYLLVGWLWFLITLAPVSGVIQVGGHSRADRYTYIPLIGIFLVVAWSATELIKLWRCGKITLRFAAFATLAGLIVVARTQTSHWHDSVSLWTHALACTPDHPESRHNLADALMAQGKIPEAIQQFELALRLKPDHILAHDALATALAMQGRAPEAIPHFRRAIELRPNFAMAHYNLSIALASQGKLDEAIQECETAVRLRPDHAEAHYNLGVAYATQGKMHDAVRHFQQAMNLATAQAKPALAQSVRARLEDYHLTLPTPQNP